MYNAIQTVHFHEVQAISSRSATEQYTYSWEYIDDFDTTDGASLLYDNKSDSSMPLKAFLQEMDAFIEILARNADIRMSTQLNRLSDNEHLSWALFRERMRTVIDCRKVPSN